jgi:hypothetical protein
VKKIILILSALIVLINYAVLDDPNTYEAWTQWKKCDQSCGAYYTSRARFWFSRERKQAYDFTYHVRYKTVDKQCPGRM